MGPVFFKSQNEKSWKRRREAGRSKIPSTEQGWKRVGFNPTEGAPPVAACVFKEALFTLKEPVETRKRIDVPFVRPHFDRILLPPPPKQVADQFQAALKPTTNKCAKLFCSALPFFWIWVDLLNRTLNKVVSYVPLHQSDHESSQESDKRWV